MRNMPPSARWPKSRWVEGLAPAAYPFFVLDRTPRFGLLSPSLLANGSPAGAKKKVLASPASLC
jgi:hypothetical protein